MKKYPFTILELLLVISIGAIMLTVALPAFNRMLKGSASGIAIRELTARLNSAKSKAMSNGSHRVAIVFPANEPITYGTTEKTDDKKEQHKIASNKRYRYRAYRACYVNESDLTFVKWVDGDNWKFLPEGIVLEATTTSPEANICLHKTGKDKEKEASSVELHGSDTLTCNIGGRSYSETATSGLSTTIPIRNFILFNRNGTLDKFPQGAVLRLREGKVNDDGLGVTTGATDEYFPIVIRATGKIKAYNELVDG